MKLREVGAYQAKTHLAELLDQVEQGETIQITRHGKLIAELRPPTTQKPKPKFGSAKGLILYMAPDFDAPMEDFKDYV